MAVFNPTKTRTWSKNTPADGDLIDDEIDRLYENDQYSKDRIDVTDANILNLLIPLGSIIEDNLNIAPSSIFKEANAQSISRTTFSILWNLVHKTVTGIVPATDRITVNAHGFTEGQLVKFAFTGGGITGLTNYYVRYPTTNDFQISLTQTGTIIDLTSSQTGDIITNIEYGFGDGSTTFNVPDRRGIFPRGAGIHGTRAKAAGGNYDGGAVGFAGQDQFQRHYTNFSYNNVFGMIGGVGSYWLNGGGTNAGNSNLQILEPITDGVNGSPRVGNETTPAYIAVKYKVRVA
ncbi:hypothetical protein [Leptospira kirschneri]|uniref:Uncharacterized protein n=1 Tax=Leptospira kirschneri serovar Bulgarica str. Nikolaevo TaxID=1240687 RepID=M6F7V9_9LEPT|nr:hypothetical protein [Leptospira kirschneri]EMK22390.1 hypothetical protein LEP1GSC008_1605 [Leptospira kirschneri serovar Bulgarica str. Nikolaevo]EMK24485.1 hypothetical protein LEP1GSC008_2678 [Leptospira kirschneri serovar Bulgarica str. Nikolaevo]EMK24882.1 hypothetical protein LEP1GSC008_0552 [Leptospira kirschneri serovar Bulgarica str. Nikolaevo]